MLYIIYKITNNINKKEYIGAHQTTNINDGYMGSGTLLNKAFKKYGKENFTKEIIQMCSNINEMFKLESTIVNEDFVLCNATYNLTTGGRGGYYHLHTHKNATEWRTKGAKQCIKVRDPERAKECLQMGALKVKELIKDMSSEQRVAFFKMPSFKSKTHSADTTTKIGEKTSKLQQGTGNSQFGKCWIHNIQLKQNKSIKKTEIAAWIDAGWLIGRKMKF